MSDKSPKSNGSVFLHIVEITHLSYAKLFVLWIALVILFAFAYCVLSIIAPAHGPSQIEGMNFLEKLLNSLYYSIITATSTGYGDITPHGFSKALASIQSISALFIFAVFVTKLVSQRQEIALQEVHRLSFEDIFHNTRGDLYIIRSDLDKIMDEAIQRGSLKDDSWDTLKIAFQQAQSIIQEIPDFYDGGNTYYTIDPRREQLLLEGVHRTLHRINQTLDTLSRANIEWTDHTDCMEELSELVKIIESSTPLWKDRSPLEKKEAFEDIIVLKEKTHGWIENFIQS